MATHDTTMGTSPKEYQGYKDKIEVIKDGLERLEEKLEDCLCREDEHMVTKNTASVEPSVILERLEEVSIMVHSLSTRIRL